MGVFDKGSGFPARKILEAYLALAYAAYYILGLRPYHDGDSWSYKDPVVLRNWTSAWNSFLGWHSRPWPIVVPYEILGEARNITAFQCLLSFFALVYLCRSFYGVIRSVPLATTGAALVSALALSPRLFSYHFHLLSESITFSLVLFSFGAAMRLFGRPDGFWSAVVFVAASTGAALVRPLTVVLLVPVGLLLLFRVARHADGARPGTLMALYMGGLLGLLWVFGWWSVNKLFWDASIPRAACVSAYALSDFSPVAPQMREALRTDLPPPPCFPVDHGLAADPTVIWTLLRSIPSCPGVLAWSRSFGHWYPLYFLGHPGDLLEFSDWGLTRALGMPRFPGLTWSLCPGLLVDWIAGIPGDILPLSGGARFDPAWAYLCVELCVAVWLWSKRRGGDLPTLLFPLVTALLSYVVALMGALCNPSNALEMGRIGLMPDLFLRMSLVFGAVYLADRVGLLRGTQPSSGESAPEGGRAV